MFLMANHSQHYKLIGWNLFFASLLFSSIPLFGQDAPMPQDIPLQKPKPLRDRDIQESLSRIGREPFNARIEDLRKIDNAEAEHRIAIVSAANKYVPGATWHSESVIIGDFTCHGRKEQAILGITAHEIIVVVFINGLQNKPEILRDKVHTPADAELTIEDLDYDPKEQPGVELEGFLRSKVCKGLNITDNHLDPFHVYWNHKDSQFNWWSR
jgi:hypothetical protein